MDTLNIYKNTESVEIYSTVDSLDTCVATDYSLVEQTIEVENSLEVLSSLLTNNEEWQVNGTVPFMISSRALEMLLYYLPTLEDSAKKQLIERLKCFAEYSDMNKWVMFKANITSRLLKGIIWKSWQSNDVAELTMRLLEIICSYSVKVSDVKLILNMICNKYEGDTSYQGDSAWYQGALVKLLYSISQKQSTLNFFYLKGIDSGIELSPIEKFPTNGYSLFTWIKLDAAPSPKEHIGFGNFTPRLFSFFTENGDGIEAYFENNELCFSCKKGRVVSTAVMNNLKFTQKRWYFIVITHSTAKRGWTSTPAEINVVVDGNITFKSRLEYPTEFYSRSFKYCAIGASSVFVNSSSSDDRSSNMNASVSTSRFYNCLRGQITTLYMIAEVLTKEQINDLYVLGPNHASQFHPYQADKTLKSNLFDGITLHQKILFILHVKASEDKICFNLAPRPSSYQEPIAATLHGIEKCSTLSLQNAIHCLGDVEILFPMIMRFDDLDSVNLQAPFGSQDDFFDSEGPCKSFFALLSSLLQNNVRSQSHVLKSRGIKVISLLLQQVGPRHFSISAFKSMMALAGTLSSNEELSREVYFNLLFEFRLWMYTSIEIQDYCIDFLKSFVDARKQMCRKLFGIQFFLDVLQNIYWYKQGEYSASHRHTTAGVTRPKPSQLKELRGKVISIINSYFKDSITKDEALFLFRNILYSEDDTHVHEILMLLVDLLITKKEMIDIFVSYGGFEIICELLKRRDENVRIDCIKVVTFLMTNSSTPISFVKKLRFEDKEPVNLIKLMHNAPMTIGIYHALLCWSLEQYSDTFEFVDKNENEISQLILPKIKNFRIILAILALLDSEGTKRIVQCRILENLIVIFKQNISYCTELYKFWFWQLYLIHLVPVYGGQDGMLTGRDNKETADWALEFIAIVIWNLFEIDKNAYRVIEETIITIWTSGRQDCLESIRSFLTHMLSLASREINTSFSASFSITKLQNVMHLLTLAEEILFNHKDLVQAVVQKNSSRSGGSYSSSSISSGYVPLKNYDDMIFQSASNPWEENQALSIIYLEVIDSLDKTGNWRLDLPSKREMQPGEICRMVLRTLIAGISAPDSELRKKSLDQLMGFVERHIKINSVNPKNGRRESSDDVCCHDSGTFQQYILMLLGEMHEAFITSQVTNGSYDEKILFAYFFIIHKSKNYLVHLSEKGSFKETFDSLWVGKEFSSHALVEFATSRNWISIHDKYIVPAMKAANEDEFTMVRRMVERLSKKVNLFLNRSKKEELLSVKSEEAFEIEMIPIVKSYKDEESNRLTSIQADKKNDDMRTSRKWLSKFHELTQERGVWSLVRQNDIHWKLDRKENYSRMRRKLTINYDYDAHREASAKRDKTPIANSANKAKNVNIQRIKKANVDCSNNSTPILNAVEPWTDGWGFSGSSLVSESESLASSEDQEWNLITGDKIVETIDISSDMKLFSTDCEMIVLLSAIKGKIELTSTHLCFFVDRRNLLQELNNIEQGSIVVDSEMLRDKKWSISDIREIHMRKYMLRRSAFELFLTDQTNYFFNFPDPRDNKRLFKKIISLRPSSMINQDTKSPTKIFQRSRLTERWKTHEISNFEYLMHLNSIAGRSFNDLTQYFVFPWILNDYESETIDLSNPNIYRDLTKPIGALNPDRLEQFVERYENFEDPSGRIKKFLYGTHYSSAATVSCYLVRLEPYTSVHISLQGGRFDHADRQFHSIQDTWKSVLTASGDVRELIPEFFYHPEFLTNHNDFDLGVRQDGTHVGNVGLPKWANSPEEFIRIHREALESDYVSENLHHWIDLIFGYKQTGEEAAKAYNIFYYLTYEGAINIDSIQDPVERKSIEQQIYHFGQTPTQLLTEPHPKRLPSRDFLKKDLLNSDYNHQRFVVELKCGRLYLVDLPNPDNELYSINDSQQVITIDENGIIGCHRVLRKSTAPEIPFTMEVDPGLQYKSKLSSPYCFDAVISPRCFACSKDGKVIISAGHWDNTIKVSLTETGRTIDMISENGRTIVTGTRSSSLLSWKVNLTHDNEFLNIEHTPIHAFYGHDDEITCVVVNAEHDILISGSKDGTCIVHSLQNAHYIRTLRPMNDPDATVEFVCISRDANIVVYTEVNDEYYLHTYSVNGKLLNSIEITHQLNHMISASDKNIILTANEEGQICVYFALSLELSHEFNVPLVGRCIRLGAQFDFEENSNASEPELLHDILFRVGVTQRGVETYTPRLLLYDLKGGFGSLKKMNRLYEESSGNQESELHISSWGLRSEIHAQMPYPKNEYLQGLEKEEEELIYSEETNSRIEVETEVKDFKLDDAVQYWSDFNSVYYHPKSINAITQYQFEDEFMPFDTFSYGKGAFIEHQKDLDSFEENFRFFAEECDAIQGFQVFTGIIDGYGGFACSFLERLREEYPKTAIESFGITENRSWEPKGHKSYYKQILNVSFSTTQLIELSSLFNIINTPSTRSQFFRPNINLPYHTSSVVSAAIETSTLPFRTRHNFISMFDLINRLNWRGNTKLGSLGLAFPLPISNFGEVDADRLLPTSNNNVIQDLSMASNGQQAITTLGQSVVIRGLPNKFELLPAKGQKSASQITAEIFQRFETLNSGSSSFFSTGVTYPITKSFPKLFTHLNPDGYIDMSIPSDQIPSVHTVPALSHLTISTKSHNLLQQLANTLQNLDFNLFPEYEGGDKGLMREEFLETREALWSLCEAFKE
ncbi:11767_t:CDS:10 [Funneliformis geosporum]|nr:11767_t:CDS:10 [Funneliformis geosporum]